MVASTLSVCRGIFILIMRVPGVSTACALFYRVLQLVEDTVRYSTTTILEMVSAEVGGATGSEASDSRGFHHSHHRHRPESYIGDPSSKSRLYVCCLSAADVGFFMASLCSDCCSA